MSDLKEIVKMEHGPGNFGECLVEGSAEDKKRGRKVKRRAIAISIALQSLGLTALVIAPMLARPAELGIVTTTPIPPYRASAPHRTQTAAGHSTTTRPCVVCFNTNPAPITERLMRDGSPGPIDGGVDLPGAPEGPDSGLNIFDNRRQPDAPHETQEKKRLVVGHIDPAMLTRRVEPVYPPLAIQIHRSGKVELHAVISMDGTIQSLQLVSGDPMFVQSAMDAVRHWRYKPTLLNGQPVEVDTFITVIYTTQQQ